MNDGDEILDLVDPKDIVIGTIRRSDAMALAADGGRYIRFASVMVMNANGKLWLPIRSISKTIAPGGYDNSAEGHVGQGESYEECALRELKEESGISASLDELQQLSYTKFPTLAYFCKYFLLRTTNEPRLSSEHTGGEWVTPSEAYTKIVAGHPAKETVRYGIELLQKELGNGL